MSGVPECGFVVSDLHDANIAAIFLQALVGRDQSRAFNGRLGDQDAVERVFVMLWQVEDCDQMFAGDRYFPIAMDQKFAPQETRIDLEIGALQTTLDRDFPKAGSAEHEFVPWIA